MRDNLHIQSCLETAGRHKVNLQWKGRNARKYLNIHKIRKKVLENQLNIMTVEMLGRLLQFDEIIERANFKSTNAEPMF